MRLFKIISGRVEIEYDDVFTIKEFADFFIEYEESKQQGGTRYQKAIDVIKFIERYSNKHITDSIYRGMDDKRKFKLIVEDLGLGKDFEITDKIEAACKKYVEIQTEYAPSVRLVNQLELALNLIHNQVDGFRTMQADLQEEILKIQSDIKFGKDPDDKKTVSEKIREITALMDMQIKQSSTVMGIVEKLPKQLELLDTMKRKAIAEVASSVMIKGGATANARELRDARKSNSLLTRTS